MLDPTANKKPKIRLFPNFSRKQMLPFPICNIFACSTERENYCYLELRDFRRVRAIISPRRFQIVTWPNADCISNSSTTFPTRTTEVAILWRKARVLFSPPMLSSCDKWCFYAFIFRQTRLCWGYTCWYSKSALNFIERKQLASLTRGLFYFRVLPSLSLIFGLNNSEPVNAGAYQIGSFRRSYLDL